MHKQPLPVTMTEPDVSSPREDPSLAHDVETVDDPLADCLMQLARVYNLPATR